MMTKRTISLSLTVALAASLAAPTANLAAQGTKTYQLAFAPAADRTLAVHYQHKIQWDYPKRETKGQRHKELTLHWRFEPRGKEYLAKGTFEQVSYKSAYGKKGGDHVNDVLWRRTVGYLAGEGSEADKKWIAEELREGVKFNVDKRAAASSGEYGKALTNQQGLLGSTLLGFAAILPGEPVAIGASWQWRGDLLNLARRENLLGTFRLVAVTEEEGEEIALIQGKVSLGLGTTATVGVELRYSIDRGLPISSKYRYESKNRTTTIDTTARWLSKDAPAAKEPTPRRR